jgi:hypothetical protein
MFPPPGDILAANVGDVIVQRSFCATKFNCSVFTFGHHTFLDCQQQQTTAAPIAKKKKN